MTLCYDKYILTIKWQKTKKGKKTTQVLCPSYWADKTKQVERGRMKTPWTLSSAAPTSTVTSSHSCCNRCFHPSWTSALTFKALWVSCATCSAEAKRRKRTKSEISVIKECLSFAAATQFFKSNYDWLFFHCEFKERRNLSFCLCFQKGLKMKGRGCLKANTDLTSL